MVRRLVMRAIRIALLLFVVVTLSADRPVTCTSARVYIGPHEVAPDGSHIATVTTCR